MWIKKLKELYFWSKVTGSSPPVLSLLFFKYHFVCLTSLTACLVCFLLYCHGVGTWFLTSRRPCLKPTWLVSFVKTILPHLVRNSIHQGRMSKTSCQWQFPWSLYLPCHGACYCLPSLNGLSSFVFFRHASRRQKAFSSAVWHCHLGMNLGSCWDTRVFCVIKV